MKILEFVPSFKKTIVSENAHINSLKQFFSSQWCFVNDLLYTFKGLGLDLFVCLVLNS